MKGGWAFRDWGCEWWVPKTSKVKVRATSIWARTEPKTEKAVHQPAAIVKGGWAFRDWRYEWWLLKTSKVKVRATSIRDRTALTTETAGHQLDAAVKGGWAFRDYNCGQLGSLGHCLWASDWWSQAVRRTGKQHVPAFRKRLFDLFFENTRYHCNGHKSYDVIQINRPQLRVAKINSKFILNSIPRCSYFILLMCISEYSLKISVSTTFHELSI